MANTGLTYKNGKLYMNGVELGGGSDVHNTFNKIVVVGTSIEATAAWPQYLAAKLGLSYYYNQNNKTSGVVNYAIGGGNVCWFGENYPMYFGEGTQASPIADITTYDDAILSAFSCSQAERTSAIEFYTNVNTWTKHDVYVNEVQNGQTVAVHYDDYYVGIQSSRVTNAANNHYENNCYDNSILGNLDADLFIFGTFGINDRPSTRLTFIDSNGNTCKTSTIRNDGLYQLDRRTIFGAYNYVLKALYEANPNAKVVILGQHTRQWNEQDIVNGVQMSVADLWRIPFADWGNHLPFNDTFTGATQEGAGKTKKTTWQVDAVHPATNGAKLMGEWVADWIAKTELTSLNPMWELE